jgi:hypothetical protein
VIFGICILFILLILSKKNLYENQTSSGFVQNCFLGSQFYGEYLVPPCSLVGVFSPTSPTSPLIRLTLCYFSTLHADGMFPASPFPLLQVFAIISCNESHSTIGDEGLDPAPAHYAIATRVPSSLGREDMCSGAFSICPSLTFHLKIKKATII